MDAKIYAVIDINVLVSALFSISGNSNPSIIIRKIIDGVITPLYNEDILAEYEEVLNRDKFPFRKADIDWLISAFLDYCPPLSSSINATQVLSSYEGFS